MEQKEVKKFEQRKYAYFWKVYNFENGRTFKEVHDGHPYCIKPAKSMSKYQIN